MPNVQELVSPRVLRAPDSLGPREAAFGCGWISSGSVRRAFLLIVVLNGLDAAPPAGAQEVTDEYRLKAAFLTRFPQFVEWPPRAVDGRESMELCVLAPNPFGRFLDELVEGESRARRAILVRQVEEGSLESERLESCHVLFVPGAASSERAVLRRVANSPVLTVGESPRFLEEGGIVKFLLVDNRVRFEIDASAAGRAGLRLSSRLLRLAWDVRGGGS